MSLDLVPVTCRTSIGGVELLMARILETGELGLESVPFAVENLAPGDVIDIFDRTDGARVFRQVKRPGGWHVFLVSPNTAEAGPHLEAALDACGARVSRGGTVLAAAVPGTVAMDLATALAAGQSEGLWKYLRMTGERASG